MTRRLSPRKRIQYYLEYVLVRWLVWMSKYVPLKLLLRFGSGLGWVAFRVVRIRRRIVLENLRTSIEFADERRLADIAVESYRNFGRLIMELAAFKRITAEKLFEMVTVKGLEHLDEALARGKGAIIFTGHFGNWELLGATVARCGYPLHVTDTDHSNKRVHRVISELRTAQGIRIISPPQPARYLLRLLRDNQFIAYLADQDARSAGIFVDFLGKPASTLRGPATFAVRHGCPVIPAFLVREGVDRHRAVFEAPMWPQPGLGRQEAVRELTQRFTTRLEEVVRRHPELYFWTHRRWKTKPEGTAH
ncbi:MAG: lysophospholipid acyltransferase family protein [Candidatus Krumholzibacteriia bacterium]